MSHENPSPVADRSILVTGGTGFVGRRLVARLLAESARVTVLHRGRSPVPDACASIVVDPWTPQTIDAALNGRRFDGIFNLAAYGVTPSERDPDVMRTVNVDCALQLLRHASAMRATFFVHTGSSAEYADTKRDEPLSETAPPERHKLYGASKAAATAALLTLAGQSNGPLAIARLFGIYGPGEAAHRLLPSLWTKLDRRERVPLSAGLQVRDLLHVDDAVDGLLAVARTVASGASPLLVNVCSGDGIVIADFARAVARAMAAPEQLLGFGDLPLRPDDLMHVVGCTAKLHASTGWRPRVSLDAGIRAAIAELEGRVGL